MKYSIGDKVKINSYDWYDQMLSIPSKLVWQNILCNSFVGIWCGSNIFYKDMNIYCGQILTIKEIVDDTYYIMEEDAYGYKFTDDMIDDLIVKGCRDENEEKSPAFKEGDRVETNDGLFGYINGIEYSEEKKCYRYYVSFIINGISDGGYYYESQLKFHVKCELVLPKFKVGDEIVKKDGLSNSYLVSSVGKNYYCLSFSNGVGVLSIKDQDEWELLSDSTVEDICDGDDALNIVNSQYDDEIEEMVKSHNKDILNDLYNLGMENSRKEAVKLGIASEHIVCPDGYEFRDGDGNLIAVDKIVLTKKKNEYPKTYRECCVILDCYSCNVGFDRCESSYEEILHNKILALRRLYICRNAYWKLYGEEMGLGKSWGPDWDNLSTNHEFIKINKGCFTYSSRVLVFPTAEMRDAFYEAFKDLIEECKELL